MNPFHKRKLGKTDVSATQLGFGGAQIGDMFVKVSNAEADQVIQATYDAGIRYFDTSAWYGRGLSEHRLGQFLRNQPRDSFVLSTRVGRVLYRPANPKTFTASEAIGGLHFE